MKYVSATTADFARRSFLGRVLGPAQRAWTAHWARRAEDATITILHALDDRALKDIGKDRSEIEPAVYGARGDGRVGERRSAAGSHSAEPRIGMCV